MTNRQEFPKSKICDMEVSRIMLGGNQLIHYTHCRDQQYVCNLIAHYNTSKKILETVALAEESGINTMVAHSVPWQLDLLEKHRKQGGKMQWITFPCTSLQGFDFTAYTEEVKQLVDRGCQAMFLWGIQADGLLALNRIDVIAKCVEIYRDCGVIAGVGAHDIGVVRACEENGINVDFYAKTLHHHDYPSAPKNPDQLTEPYTEDPGYWCRDPEGDIKYMQTVDKPWIAFKVLAAGTILPESGFEYAFRNGADSMFVGMFDYEIEKNIVTAREVLAREQDRTRPWH